MPDIMDAVPAKVEMMALQPKASCGYRKPTADIHPAGKTTKVRSPSTLSANRTARLPPHPAQALCPRKSSLSGKGSLAESASDIVRLLDVDEADALTRLGGCGAQFGEYLLDVRT